MNIRILRKHIRHFCRWAAIKSGAYPRFITRRLMWKNVHAYCDKIILDNIYEGSQSLKFLKKDGSK